MKRGDDNELERKLRLEKVVTRLTVEMEEERRARLEKMVATKRLRLALETEEERRAKNGLGFKISRNELVRPVMGTIFLVYLVSVLFVTKYLC